MLKSLHRNDTQIIPYIATKNWNLSNVKNEDSILMEHSGSDGLPVALEYLEYTSDGPIINSGCNIAKEQQGLDKITPRSGLKTTGIFYPESDPKNDDGTYQRLVYAQIAATFYNNYRNPTEMWGMEEIDFEKSQAKKFVADKFKVFDIPRIVFGEKIIENTVVLYDTTTDNNYVITDDGHCNLFAGTNLFSHQQEIRHFQNEYQYGYDQFCDFYNTIGYPSPSSLLSVYNPCIPPSVYLQWNMNYDDATNYILQKSIDGINFDTSWSFNSNTLYYFDTNITYSNAYWYRMYIKNLLGTSSFSNTSSVFAYSSSWDWDTDPDFWDAPCNPIYWDDTTREFRITEIGDTRIIEDGSFRII